MSRFSLLARGLVCALIVPMHLTVAAALHEPAMHRSSSSGVIASLRRYVPLGIGLLAIEGSEATPVPTMGNFTEFNTTDISSLGPTLMPTSLPTTFEVLPALEVPEMVEEPLPVNQEDFWWLGEDNFKLVYYYADWGWGKLPLIFLGGAGVYAGAIMGLVGATCYAQRKKAVTLQNNLNEHVVDDDIFKGNLE